MSPAVVMAAIAIGVLLGMLGWVWMMSARGLPEAGDLFDGSRMSDQVEADR